MQSHSDVTQSSFNEFQFTEKMKITLNDQVIIAKRMLDHSLQIYDLSNGWLVGIPSEHYKTNERNMQIECDYYNELIKAGLHATALQKISIKIEDFSESIPAYLMPSFAELEKAGKQVRIQENLKLSQGKSYIFGSTAMIDDINHWRAIFKGMKGDIINYLLSNKSIGYRAFNILIANTLDTPKDYREHSSLLFTHLNQTLHLYFCCFTRMLSHNEASDRFLLDRDGAFREIIFSNFMEDISEKISTALICAVSEEEERQMFGGVTFNSLYLCIKKSTAFKKALAELTTEIRYYITDHLAAMTELQRMQYTVPAPKLKPEQEKAKEEWLQALLKQAEIEAEKRVEIERKIKEKHAPTLSSPLLFNGQQIKNQAVSRENKFQSNDDSKSLCHFM